MKAIRFINWTSEDFSHTWDSEVYEFPMGEVVMLNENLAQHFAKHLVDRELNKKGLPTNHFSRGEFEAKCFVGESLESRTKEHLEAAILNVDIHADLPEVKIESKEEAEVKVPAKRGRPFSKKEESVEEKEQEFPDLKA